MVPPKRLPDENTAISHEYDILRKELNDASRLTRGIGDTAGVWSVVCYTIDKLTHE